MSITEFNLIATLSTEDQSRAEHTALRFDWTFKVKYLQKVGEKSTFYNSDLDMHFENKAGMGFLYEVEIAENYVLGSASIEQSESLIRRLNFRYDWMQIVVNLEGKVVDIQNKKELNTQWKKLRNTVLEHYQGEEVEDYLNKIDKEMISTEKVWSVISRYLVFGLLFPQIPPTHKLDWRQTRLVELSDYEEEKFEETTIYTDLSDNLRSYAIIGKSILESEFELKKFEGIMQLSLNSFFPQHANVEVELNHDEIVSKWNFKLERIS